MQVFWGRMRSGGFISEAVELIDTSRRLADEFWSMLVVSDLGGAEI
jgi:hypothetical protein